MTLTETQIDELNHMIPGLELGTILAGLQSAPGVSAGSIVDSQISPTAAIELSKLAHGTDGQIIIVASNGALSFVTPTGDVIPTDAGLFTIGANTVTAPKAKYVTRTLTIAIGAKTATVTNEADINGIPSTPYFSSATLDATGNEMVSFQFIPSTGQIIATLNANATAAVTVNVPILQAA